MILLGVAQLGRIWPRRSIYPTKVGFGTIQKGSAQTTAAAAAAATANATTDAGRGLETPSGHIRQQSIESGQRKGFGSNHRQQRFQQRQQQRATTKIIR